MGNSITQNGEFHHNILLHYLTRYPTEQVTFFNCGVSGDVTGGILKRMDEDILVHRPNYAVIMIGMNDVSRAAYGPRPTTNVDTLKQRERALAVYKTNLDSIVRVLLSKQVTVILQKPSIYDQTAVLPRPNNFGVNDALKACADFMQTLADTYKLQTVDYWTIMANINRTMQQKDPSATIIGADRVHPGSPGHLVMAYQFLAATEHAQPIARVCLDNTQKQSQRQSENCPHQRIRSSGKSGAGHGSGTGTAISAG